MESGLLSVIVPVYCNERTLAALHARIKGAVGRAPHEIVFVDNASSDRSREVLAELARQDPSVRIAPLLKNVGQNRAVLEGLFLSRGSRAVILDADLEDPPEAIPELLRSLEQGADAVFAGRDEGCPSRLRSIGGKSFRWLLHKIVKTPLDAGLFVAIDREVISSVLQLRPEGSYVVGMIRRSAKKIVSVPVERRCVQEGRSVSAFSNKAKKGFYASGVVLIIAALVFLAAELKSVRKKISHLEKLNVGSVKRVEYLLQELYLKRGDPVEERLPLQLQHLPFADEEGIVLSTRLIDIPGISAPYNASLIDQAGRYFLFFRYDIPAFDLGGAPFRANIGCVELDRTFEPLAPFFRLDTGSPFSEDPRAAIIGDTCYLTYNDALRGMFRKRRMHMGVVDLEAGKVHSIRSFEPRKFAVEKNWMPFAPDGKTIHFIYTITPHEVCRVLSSGTVQQVCATSSSSALAGWEEAWGRLRGGTPPQLVDGEYLSFFHSAIQDPMGFSWYVMGAYTFEAEPPYRITKVSKCPLLFKGIFSSLHRNTANPRVRCIYPAGFVVSSQDGKEVLHVSCGENDSAVRVLTLDKQKLLNSLKRVPF